MGILNNVINSITQYLTYMSISSPVQLGAIAGNGNSSNLSYVIIGLVVVIVILVVVTLFGNKK